MYMYLGPFTPSYTWGQLELYGEIHIYSEDEDAAYNNAHYGLNLNGDD